MKDVRLLLLIPVFSLIIGCQHTQTNKSEALAAEIADTAVGRQQIIMMLDSFNRAAAAADFNGYFNLFAPDAVFCGTDAAERWDKNAFMTWAKPYFDKKKTWNFTSIQRHITFGKQGNIAWFDELLNTQMKICRGSGVVVKQNGEWKVEQYILSATIPNRLMDSVVTLKTLVEDSVISVLTKQNAVAQ